MRDIAADAGIDSALIFSYFGDKLGLLRAVFSQSIKPVEFFKGDPDKVSAQIAAMLVGISEDASTAEFLLIILRSMSNPQAAEAIQQQSREHVALPLAALLGAPDALVRATLVSAILLGFSAMHAIAVDLQLSSKQRERLEEMLKTILHAILTNDPVVLGPKEPKARSARSGAPKAPRK